MIKNSQKAMMMNKKVAATVTLPQNLLLPAVTLYEDFENAAQWAGRGPDGQIKSTFYLNNILG